MKEISKKIFKQGSVTFFTASLFFPKFVREDVFDLYAFVRVFDNFVDTIPQDQSKYFGLKLKYHAALLGAHCDDEVLVNFINLQEKYTFDQLWIDEFFNSMEMDFHHATYNTIEDTQKYIYGSAEVIGLMMARIMKLHHHSYPYAQALGRAFQYMNMLRDIPEDTLLGRTYLPKTELAKFGLDNLSLETVQANPDGFKNLMAQEIQRYRQWRKEAEQGFAFIPKRLRIPILAATETFDITVNKIEQQPMLIYKQKIKPSRLRILWSVLKHSL